MLDYIFILTYYSLINKLIIIKMEIKYRPPLNLPYRIVYLI